MKDKIINMIDEIDVLLNANDLINYIDEGNKEVFIFCINESYLINHYLTVNHKIKMDITLSDYDITKYESITDKLISSINYTNSIFQKLSDYELGLKFGSCPYNRHLVTSEYIFQILELQLQSLQIIYN